MTFRISWFALSLFLLAPRLAPVSAQERTAEGLRVGVVLSGGGAKGFAHIGVLRVLEERGTPVHAVVGNSMGGFIGALYAIGYTPASLETIAIDTDWTALSSDAIPREQLRLEQRAVEGRHLITLPFRGGTPGLPANLVAGQRLFELLSRLMWPARQVRDFRDLPIPFATVATDIETGEAVNLRRGSLVDAVRASMSIPGALSPVTIDGRTLVDGMLIRNLPARDARQLGADVLICSDVSAPLAPADSLQTILDVMDQVISFRGDASRQEDRALCDILIEPPTDGLTSFSFDRATESIERGRQEAETHAEALDRINRAAAAHVERPALRNDSTFIENVTFEGAADIDRRVLFRMLDLTVPTWLTASRLEAAIERLHVTGAFRAVSYRMETAGRPGAARLVVRLEGTAPDEFGFGVRYESRYKASFLLSASIRDLLAFGSRTEVDMRLGQQLQFVGRHHRRFGLYNALAFSAEAGWARLPFDRIENDRRLTTADVELWHASAFGGFGIGRGALFGVEVKGEHARPKDGGPSGTATNQTYHTVSGVLHIDTRDRITFPTRGVVLAARYERSDRSIGSTLEFSQQTVRGEVHLPLYRTLTASARAALGGTTGNDLPPHYLFYLGGAYQYFLMPQRHLRFLGLETQELVGANVQAVGLELQHEFVRDVFAIATWNAGTMLDTWRFDVGDYVHGFGLTIGARTRGGIASATVAWSNSDRRPNLTVNMGFPF